MKLRRKGLLAATGAAAAGLALTGGLIAASTASAATAGHSAITAQGSSSAIYNTLSGGHMDTTSFSGSATFTSPNGPVWAIDTLKEHWVVTACSASTTCTADNDGANYAVTLTVEKGSKFAEFADPGQGTNETSDPCAAAPYNATAGGPHTGQGNVAGTIEYDVSSPTAPDLSGVPAVQQPNTSLGTVIGQIFDGNQTIAGGGAYSFTYTSVCGAVYGQSG
jgi:hypothetical protein